MKWYNRISTKTYVFITLGVLVFTALLLHFMGQIWICKCGYVRLWHGVVFSSENSQHLSDWYSLTHAIHGFVFFFFFWLVRKKWKLPLAVCFLGALFLESAWELFENSDFIINRYREVTISLDYYGDSVINSISDILFMSLGFLLASRLRVSLSIVFVIVLELMLAYFIRDNLTINIIMLTYPIEAIKLWQGSV